MLNQYAYHCCQQMCYYMCSYFLLDPVFKVTLSVSNLQKSLEYWNKLLGMKIVSQSDSSAELTYSDSQVLVCVVYVKNPSIIKYPIVH